MVCFSIWYLQYSARLCKQTYSFVWKSLPKVVCVPKLFCLLVYSLCFEYCRCLFTYLQLSRCYVYWFVRLRLRALPRHNYLQPIRKVWKMSNTQNVNTENQIPNLDNDIVSACSSQQTQHVFEHYLCGTSSAGSLALLFLLFSSRNAKQLLERLNQHS